MGVAVFVGLGVCVGLNVSVGVGVRVGEAVLVAVGLGVAVEVGGGVGVGCTVFVAMIAVGVGDCAAVQPIVKRVKQVIQVNFFMIFPPVSQGISDLLA